MSTTSSGSSSIEPILCKHGIEADVLVSTAIEYPFRRYYRCTQRSDAVNDCGYFKWLDPEIQPYQRECIQSLNVEKNRLEDMVVLMAEHIRIKDGEIEELEKLKIEGDDLVDHLWATKVEMDFHSQKLMVKVKVLERRLSVSNIMILILVAILIARVM